MWLSESQVLCHGNAAKTERRYVRDASNCPAVGRGRSGMDRGDAKLRYPASLEDVDFSTPLGPASRRGPEPRHRRVDSTMFALRACALAAGVRTRRTVRFARLWTPKPGERPLPTSRYGRRHPSHRRRRPQRPLDHRHAARRPLHMPRRVRAASPAAPPPSTRSRSRPGTRMDGRGTSSITSNRSPAAARIPRATCSGRRWRPGRRRTRWSAKAAGR
jgi:hypothetical protein